MSTTPPRRSKRIRKEPESIYKDTSGAQLHSGSRDSWKAKRRRTSKRDQDDESEKSNKKRKVSLWETEPNEVVEEEEEQDEEEQEEEEQEEEEQEEEEQEEEDEIDDEEENEEEEQDEEEEEEFTPAKVRKRTSPSPKRAAASKPRQISISAPTGASKKKSASSKSAQAALTAIAKKVLKDDETIEDSLVAALLRAGKPSNTENTKGKHLRIKRTQYTDALLLAADRVINKHLNDPNAAQVDVYNLLFRSVGASTDTLLDPDEVDLETLEDEEMTEHVTSIVKNMEETPQDLVLLPVDALSKMAKRSVAVKEFAIIYKEFWYLLGTSILTDGFSARKKRKSDADDNDGDDESSATSQENQDAQIDILQEISNRMMELTILGQDDIRSGTTVAVYQLVVAMLERWVELNEKLEIATRQLNVARKNRMPRKSAVFKRQVETWKSACERLEEIVGETVMGTFTKRYRDINPCIRAESLSALTRFMVVRPDYFLKNSYLKYLGWMLSDKDAMVREQAIRGLLAPLQAAGQSKKKRKQAIDTSLMIPIVKKFLPRLADCTMDVDIAVQEYAIELLLILLREGFLDELADDGIWEKINRRALASDTSPAVRRDALLFVIEQLDAFDDDVKTQSNEVERINALGRWVSHELAEGTTSADDVCFDPVVFVIASLRSCAHLSSLASNFSAMLKALQNCGESSEAASSQADRNLESIRRQVFLELLVSAVDQEDSSTLDGTPLARITDPDLRSSRQSEERSRDGKRKSKSSALLEKLTVAMLKALPDLLRSYKTETSLLRRLTTLPKYLLPSILNSSEYKRNFSSILDELSGIFRETADQATMYNCILAITLFAKGDFSRSNEAMVVLKKDCRALCDGILRLFEEKESSVGNEYNLETENAISLALLRILTISKRWDMRKLLRTDDDEIIDNVCNELSEELCKALAARKPVFGDSNELSVGLVPEIWESAPKELHVYALSSIKHGTSLLMTFLMWEFKAVVDKPEQSAEDAESIIQSRNRLAQLLSLCFDQFIENRVDDEQYSEHHRSFSFEVQAHAGKITSDLRLLLPKHWVDSDSPFLCACALTNDLHLNGGFVRFARSFGSKLQSSDLEGTERLHLTKTILEPIARGVFSSWKTANRREAGVLLAHGVGFGDDASNMVSEASRILKKLNPVRVIETHMACIGDLFEDWAAMEPEEVEEGGLSEDDLEQYEQAKEEHAAKFHFIEQQAKRLSSSLGVGKLSDKRMKNALHAFLREGLRFAFSTESAGEQGNLFLGARLPFLRLLSKYLVWVRKDKVIADVRKMINSYEEQLRNHRDFADVLDEDLEAIQHFRKVGDLGTFLVEDDEDSQTEVSIDAVAASQSSTGREHSLQDTSSIRSTRKSLSPLEEEEEEEEEEEMVVVEDDDDDEPSRATPYSSKNGGTRSHDEAQHRSGAQADDADVSPDSQLGRGLPDTPDTNGVASDEEVSKPGSRKRKPDSSPDSNSSRGVPDTPKTNGATSDEEVSKPGSRQGKPDSSPDSNSSRRVPDTPKTNATSDEEVSKPGSRQRKPDSSPDSSSNQGVPDTPRTDGGAISDQEGRKESKNREPESSPDSMASDAVSY